MLTSPHSATRGLLATDLEILDHCQVPRLTTELEPSSPNFHIIPTRGCLSQSRFNVHQPHYTAGLPWLRFELMAP
ncbi:hypothetical protein TNCV_1760291 [Trichonephila clavipes]|nr:hypothetical protein TNCV_1760291 [Trichonephila clavipes]